MRSSLKIKRFIIDNLSEHQKDIVKTSITKFGLSRPAILKHMNDLIKSGKVAVNGNTRDRTYRLLPLVNYIQSFKLKTIDNIDHLIIDEFLFKLKFCTKNIYEICEFGITTLLNNVIDHSDANMFKIEILVVGQDIQITIEDDGIGLFENINQKLKLNNYHLAAIELSKGKANNPSDHQLGVDVYLLFHLFNEVSIDADGVRLIRDCFNDEWKFFSSDVTKGTKICIKTNFHYQKTCSDVFKTALIEPRQYKIPISLARANKEKFISRRQADNLLYNISDLEKIEFDFKGVSLIGPAFADELIRKVKEKNNNIQIGWINTTDVIDLLMKRAINSFS